MKTRQRSFRQYLSEVISAFAGPAPVDERREELLTALRVDLEQEIQTKQDQHERYLAEEENQSHRHVMGLMDDLRFSHELINRGIDHSISRLTGYSTTTITMLHSAFHGTGNVNDFINYAPHDEIGFRSALAFNRIVPRNGQLVTVIKDVRNSTGIDDFSELEPGTAGHDLMTAVLTVAVGISENRQQAYFSQHENSGSSSISAASGFGKWLKQENNRCKMTPELAIVIVDCPERITDILNYIDRRNGDIEGLDGGHLRIHLDNAALSLSDGVL